MADSIKSICVYCGASQGTQTIYADAARALGKSLVERNLALVYGGGNIGLMGIIADEVMRLGGKVTGVIPRALMEREIGHPGLTQLHVVNDMHERKAMMAELSDGFIAMPGGIGTLEELFEMYTWLQLGIHDKPLGILNTAAYFDPLLQFLSQAVQQGFLKEPHFQLLQVEQDPQRLLELLHLQVSRK